MELVWFSTDTGPDSWNGKFSKCTKGGEIHRFLQQHGKSGILLLPSTDGFVRDPPDLSPDTTGINKLNFTTISDKRHAELEALLKSGHKLIYGLLCTRAYTDPKILYLPFDDEIFAKGLLQVLQPYPKLPWKDRIGKAFWRGGCSGHPFMRSRVVEALRDHPHADAKLIRRWDWNHRLPPWMFDAEAGPDVYMRHKYCLIVDGGVIASSHMWIFGTGAVPILVSHPDNRYWFYEWLVPGVNCIMVGYDLDALVQTIHWLVTHDKEAEEIAKNAQVLADRIFSADFQQAYVKSELDRLA